MWGRGGGEREETAHQASIPSATLDCSAHEYLLKADNEEEKAFHNLATSWKLDGQAKVYGHTSTGDSLDAFAPQCVHPLW